ncbi:unnamed protein product [Vitrella brassicaformis CCMP3155]|uniref:Uncharacterized protein n=1 Tax=Vitrella brassicaformis (strain CCMP3155) TaxID=1169540 RepID=A0A0G4GRZ7_VITBC|nr:unnamed protein product [Vitrella brassicaformis CCMP3155]|eukprot:CEM33373.1 unnamed protein product [Vitrella brassicaformis CCMP3155]
MSLPNRERTANLLTLNTAIAKWPELDGPPLPTRPLLKDDWTVYVQLRAKGGQRMDVDNYKEYVKAVGVMRSLREFWPLYEMVPMPSQMDRKKVCLSDGSKEEVEGVMIFKDRIEPKWEHPANKGGGSIRFAFQYRKLASLDLGSKVTTGGMGIVDEYWMSLVCAAIGNTLQNYDIIAGVKLVRKDREMRIELWFTKADKGDVAALKAEAIKAMCTAMDGKLYEFVGTTQTTPHERFLNGSLSKI